MPPTKPWNKDELRQAGAIGGGPVHEPNISGDPHQIFARERWIDIDDETYQLLLPSMLLASKFLEVGLPYIANFLPSDPLFDALDGKRTLNENHYVVEILEDCEESKKNGARRELVDLAQSIEWHVNYNMFRSKGWLGINILVRGEDLKRQDLEFDPYTVAESDIVAKQYGAKRRPLTIGICGEYVQALRALDKHSEEHLRAQFMSAYTMAHELGHSLWAQDFRSLNYSRVGQEPYVGKDAQAELGYAFMGWVFSAYNPKAIDLDPDANRQTQIHGVYGDFLAWCPVPTVDAVRCTTDAWYSISTSKLQELFSQAFWKHMGSARARLCPVKKTSASCNMRQWTVDREYGGLEWISPFFDRRPEPSLATAFISKREIEKVKDELRKQRLRNKKLSKRSRRRAMFGDDDDEEFGGELDDKGESDDPSDKFFTEESGPEWLRFDKDRPVYSLPLVERDLDDSTPESDLEVTDIKIRWQLQNDIYEPPLGNFEDFVDGHQHKKKQDSTVSSRIDPHADLDDRFGTETADYDAGDVNQLLSYKDYDTVGLLSRICAYKYCQKHGIRFGRNLESDEDWQNRKIYILEFTDKANAAKPPAPLIVGGKSYPKEYDIADLALMARILQYSLAKAEKLYGAEDRKADLIEIKEHRARLFDDLDDDDLLDICQAHGLPTEGDNYSQLLQIKRWNDEEILRLELEIEAQLKAKETADENIIVERRPLHLEFKRETFNMEDMKNGFISVRDVEDILAKYNLPKWGNMNCLANRAFEAGKDPRKNYLNRRKRYQGYKRHELLDELHTFSTQASLEKSSVGVLKSTLYKETSRLFPFNCYFHLYFGLQRTSELEDSVPLANYKGDWEDLWLECSIEPKSQPAYERKSKDGPGSEDASYQDETHRNQTARAKAAETLQRQLDIEEGLVLPTAGELMATVSRNQVDISGTTHFGELEMRPQKRGRPIKSATKIFDNLEDLEEVREEKRAKIAVEIDRLAPNTDNGSGDVGDLMGLPAKAPGDDLPVFAAPGPMLSLYKQIGPDGKGDPSAAAKAYEGDSDPNARPPPIYKPRS